MSSSEPDTSELDDRWVKHEPRHSYIALRSAPQAPPVPAPHSSPHAEDLAHDVWESVHALLVLVELPGVAPEHVSLSLGSHSLFLEVTVPTSTEGFGLGAGRYELVIEAPDGLAPDAVDASLCHGLLRVRVSKENAGARRLSIASTEGE